MTNFPRHERSLTLGERRGRRVAAWMATAVVAACASEATDVVTTNVGSVSITPASTTVAIGAQIPLHALVQDPSGRTITGMNIFWSVQSPSIATVSNTGVVTGMALGSTQVAANVNGKSGIAVITVEKTSVASVVVTPPHVDAAPGVQVRLSATAYDSAQNPLSGRAILWSTSNAAVANVDMNGMMTAAGTGSATVTATSEGKIGTATITVTQAAVATVTVTPSPLTISVGQQTQLAATLKDAAGNVLSGRTVSWSSSNTGVATVSAQGVLTAVAVGSTTITAASEGKSGTTSVTVTQAPVGSVTVAPTSASIGTSKTTTFTATVKDSFGNVLTNRPVAWSSSNPAIATVNGGVVTGVAVGTATITATAEGKTGTATINVTAIPVATVVVSPMSKAMLVTQIFPLSVTVTDSAGNVVTDRVVTWGSSNTGVATVSAIGVVTAVATGTATITATSEGKSGAATITVNPVPVSSVTITPPSPDTVVVASTTQLAAVTKDSAGNVLTGRVVTWQSNNTAVATVGATGLVTGVAVGTATITATSEGKSGAITLVSIKAPVGSVAVAPSVDSVTTTGSKSTKTVVATVKDVNGTVVTDRIVNWTSTPGTVASVSPSSGASTTVTGGSVGQAQVIATSETKTATASIKVIPEVTSVEISPTTATLSLLGVLFPSTVTLTATVKGAANTTVLGRTIAWSSSNESVATVDANGKVTARGLLGIVTITATVVFDGVTSTASITVTP
jgi:uncharacterized protein YjdB